MMKTEKIVLGDSEDMEGLLEKQKVTVRYKEISAGRYLSVFVNVTFGV